MLTGVGITWAATTGQSNGDPYPLQGIPPHSTELALQLTAGQPYGVSVHLNIDFADNALAGNVIIPAGFTSVSASFIVLHHTLYVNVPTLSKVWNSQWVSTPIGKVSLFGLAAEMTHPDLSLLPSLAPAVVTVNGWQTTHTYHPPSRLAGLSLKNADVSVSVTTGTGGEVSAASATVQSASTNATLSLKVVSYNHSPRILAPLASEVRPISGLLLQQNLGGTASSLLKGIGVSTPSTPDAGALMNQLAALSHS